MRTGNRDEVLTVEASVRAAAAAADPEQASEGVTALVESFESDERPATAPEDLADELRSAADAIDPEGVDPPVSVAAATTLWLTTNPSDADDPDHAVREGVRLFFGKDVPAGVADWLQARGIE